VYYKAGEGQVSRPNFLPWNGPVKRVFPRQQLLACHARHARK
jgi:hypothetical protein